MVVAFPDMQGRPVGKRVTGPFFLDHVLEHGIEACDYLLAVDVDMEPLPGYRFANWETGYGDIVALPDLATLRLLPWLEGSAMVVCDLVGHRRAPRRGVAPAGPRTSDRAGRGSSASTSGAPPSSSSTCSARPSRRRRPRAGATCTRTCRPSRTTSCCRRRARNTSSGGSATRCWRPTSPSSSPRVRPAGASTRSTSPTGGPSRWPTGTSSSRTASRRSPTSAGGRPRSWPSGRWTRSARRATSTPACGTPSPAPR